MKKEFTGELECSFCGKNQREVRKLIAGPAVYICDECIKLCNDIFAREARREEPARDETASRPNKEGPKESRQTLCCSFCGKSQREVSKLIAGPTVYICDECIGLCNDIIAEEIERATVTESVGSIVPEDARVSIARILARGVSAARRVSSFSCDRKVQILDAVGDGDSKPSFEVLTVMGSLASTWIGLDQFVGGRTGDPALESPADGGVREPAGSPLRTEEQLGEWVRQITERLNFGLEVLDSLARRLEEPGFDPSHDSLVKAQEVLDEAGDLLTAGPPRPPVD